MSGGPFMPRMLRIMIAAGLVIGAGSARAQSLSVSGSPSPMVVSTAIAGATPQPEVDGSTTYTVFAPLSFNTKKITAQINSPMPAGVTLRMALQATNNGTSQGYVTLGTTARDVVTNIGWVFWETHGITYELSATLAAGVVPRQTRIVTLTITSAP